MKNKRDDLDKVVNIHREEANKNSSNSKKVKNIIYIIILILLISFLVIWYKKEKYIKVSETNNGKYEIYTETSGYVLNKEKVVEYNKDENLIPIAESEKRVTINSVIGIYKNEEYENGLKELSKMDEEINQKLKLLPEIYSNEVTSIDKEIDIITSKMKGISSYIQMVDYKTKLDNLAYKKALTVSSLTPSGSDIKSLILRRDEYKQNMSTSTNNVKAPISGIIIYENDGLENKFDFKNISEISEEKIEQIVTEYNKTPQETFGIKIVDNYESYIIIKEDKVNDKYIVEGRTYSIELLDKNSKINGLLIKKISNEKCNYCIFKISNNIEQIVDLRKTDIKVIWKELNGFVVNNTSIKTLSGIDYVTILSLNKYVDIPVINLIKLDNTSLVRNYTKEEKTNLGLEDKQSLAIYDRVVENNK
jgi:putative membrane fusion protein